MSVRRLVIAIAAASLLAAPIAAAQPQPAPAPAPAASQTLTFSQIESRLAADGFRIVEIERYANSIEVKGYERGGACVEMHLDKRTGDVLRREYDDDCDRRDDDGRGRRGRH